MDHSVFQEFQSQDPKRSKRTLVFVRLLVLVLYYC